MSRDQKIVGLGAASGVLAMVAAMAGLYHVAPTIAPFADMGARLAFAVQADAFAVIPLLIGVMVVGNGRFLSEAIDPTLHKEGAALQVDARVLDNTLQQFVVFFIATTALATRLSIGEMRLIPAAVIVFVVARLAFWIGYRIQPLYRAFGMAATGYLNLGLLGYALWKIAVSGI